MSANRILKNGGFTMVEMVVVLGIIGVLAAILTPVVMNYVDQSRVARAQSDVRTIGEAISRFEKDLGRYPMFATGSGALQDTSANVVRLDGPGTAVTDTSGNTTAWVAASPTDSDCVSGCVADDLADHLLLNTPAYTTTTSLVKPFKWKGPYLSPDTDPWGRRYVVNIINAKSSSNDACFVLSAGPNGQVETPFNIPLRSVVTASGDDIIYRIK